MELLEEFDEFQLQAYENTKIYKEKMKKWHDSHIIKRTFELRQQVLLFNTHLKLFPGKLRSKWSELYIVVNVTPHGAMELREKATNQTFGLMGNVSNTTM